MNDQNPSSTPEPEFVPKPTLVPDIAPGIEPGDLAKRPSIKGGVRVVSIDYCPEHIAIEEVLDISAFVTRHRPEWSQTRWINVIGLEDMDVIRLLSEKYDLHPLAIEDLLSFQRPKADDYPATETQPPRLFVLAWYLAKHDGKFRNEQISFFVGRKTLITFLRRDKGIFDAVRQRLHTKGARLRTGDTSFLFYSLMDAMIDQYFPLLDHYSNRLEKLERQILDKPHAIAMNDLHRVKRELILIRRSAWGMRDLVHRLQRQPHECQSEMTRQYFRDVHDHIAQIDDYVETYREFVSGLTDTHMSAINNRMNEVVKTLTIISTIFVPLTFLAGVYGMNMPIPENERPWMYPLFWGICITSAAGMLVWFKKRGWF